MKPVEPQDRTGPGRPPLFLDESGPHRLQVMIEKLKYQQLQSLARQRQTEVAKIVREYVDKGLRRDLAVAS